MTNPTFEQPDFICLMPCAWGRAKTAREAWRICKSNYSEQLFGKKKTARIYRLADQVDRVEIGAQGELYLFSHKNEEGVRPPFEHETREYLRLCVEECTSTPTKKIPEFPEKTIDLRRF